MKNNCWTLQKTAFIKNKEPDKWIKYPDAVWLDALYLLNEWIFKHRAKKNKVTDKPNTISRQNSNYLYFTMWLILAHSYEFVQSHSCILVEFIFTPVTLGLGEGLQYVFVRFTMYEFIQKSHLVK